MRLSNVVWVLALAVSPLRPGAIFDVTSHTTQKMYPGDTLYFLVSDLTMPVVDRVSFQFFSAPIDLSTQFEAALMSRDGSTSVEFSSPVLTAGVFSGSLYSGAVTVISGELSLPDGVSADIFQNKRATLMLRDLGPAVTVGLAPYTLTQDLSLTLGYGPVSAGAVTNGTLYEDPPPPAETPESDSRLLVALAGVLLCLCSRALKRISDYRIQ